MTRFAFVAVAATVFIVGNAHAVDISLESPVPAAQIRPFANDLNILQKPVDAFARTTRYQGTLTIGKISFPISGEAIERGSIKPMGKDLLWESTSQSTFRFGDEGKTSSTTNRIVLAPNGEIKQAGSDAKNKSMDFSRLLLVAMRPQNPVRLGQEVWRLDSLLLQLKPLFPTASVKRNNSTFKAAGKTTVQGREQLVVDGGGGVELSVDDGMPWKLRLPSQCLIDLPTGMWSACIGAARVEGLMNDQPVAVDLQFQTKTAFGR
ncbi:MAG: hypothetical protein NTY59_08680 [Alphaproteobacteria bacterium]|nr:hypothetical protein [Alphaproteobacteria bacterium]